MPMIFPTYAEVRAALLTDVITAPAHWAGYLVNGCCDNMTEADMDAADARFLGADVVDMIEDSVHFSWNFRIFGGDAEGGDVADYVVTFR